jgi:hypothetical protein
MARGTMPLASFAGSGVIDAPLAMDVSRPKVTQSFKTPAHKGSEGRVVGVDFVGTFGSLSSAYSITTFDINARNPTLFPRLSAIASVWRRYFPKKVRFHLFGISAATQEGYTAMSSLVTDDLATLSTPTTEAQILNQENVAVGRPWSCVTHDVNLGGLGLDWYTSDVASGSGEFGEYIGRSFLGIPQTTADNDILIQVYVEYDMEFCQRIAASLVSSCVSVGGSIDSGGTLAITNVLGDAATLDPQTNGLSVDSAGNITIVRAGSYVGWVAANGPSLAGPSVPSGTGCSFTSFSSLASGSTAFWIFAFDATAGAVLDPFTLSSGTVLAGTARIGAVPPGAISKPRSNQESLADQLSRLRVRVDEARPLFARK